VTPELAVVHLRQPHAPDGQAAEHLKTKEKENQMPVTTNEFAAAIQRALPEAKVFWEKEPDSFFT